MNQRQATRVAAGLLARFARERAEVSRGDLVAGFYTFAPEATTRDDTERVANALDRIGEELERRANGERKPPAGPSLDPGQLSWLDLEEIGV